MSSDDASKLENDESLVSRKKLSNVIEPAVANRREGEEGRVLFIFVDNLYLVYTRGGLLMGINLSRKGSSRLFRADAAVVCEAKEGRAL